MTIMTDKETYCDMDEVARGFAHVAPLKVCFRARPEVNTRIMEAIAKEFKVYQYVHENKGGVPYESAWDFFFWCYADTQRQMDYFTLSSHKSYSFQKEFDRTIEERENDYKRLREFLETRFSNEECEVCFEWNSEDDAAAILAEAKRIYEELGNGKFWVEFHGEIGRLYYTDRLGYYFKKKGSKKYVLKLTWRGVCSVSKWEKAKAA